MHAWEHRLTYIQLITHIIEKLLQDQAKSLRGHSEAGSVYQSAKRYMMTKQTTCKVSSDTSWQRQAMQADQQEKNEQSAISGGRQWVI